MEVVWLVPGDRCVLVQLMVSLGQRLGFRAMAMEVASSGKNSHDVQGLALAASV